MSVAQIAEELTYTFHKNKILGVNFFFPSINNGEIQSDSPLANYVFVEANLKDKALLLLEQSRFVDMVLCTPGSVGNWREVNRISAKEVHNIIKQQHSDVLRVGSSVLIEKGSFTGLYGTIVEIQGEDVKVYVELLSRKRVVSLSRCDVIKQEEPSSS